MKKRRDLCNEEKLFSVIIILQLASASTRKEDGRAGQGAENKKKFYHFFPSDSLSRSFAFPMEIALSGKEEDI